MPHYMEPGARVRRGRANLAPMRLSRRDGAYAEIAIAGHPHDVRVSPPGPSLVANYVEDARFQRSPSGCARRKTSPVGRARAAAADPETAKRRKAREAVVSARNIRLADRKAAEQVRKQREAAERAAAEAAEAAIREAELKAREEARLAAEAEQARQKAVEQAQREAILAARRAGRKAKKRRGR